MATVRGYSSWGHKKSDMTEQTLLASNLAFQGLLKYLLNESMQEGLRSKSSGKNAEKIIQTLVIIIMKTENTVLNIHLFELWVNGAVN